MCDWSFEYGNSKYGNLLTSELSWLLKTVYCDILAGRSFQEK